MNYLKIAQAFFENRKGSSTLPKPLAWALRHYKLLLGLIVGGFVLFILLIFGVLISAILFFTRNSASLPSSDNLIQSGRDYLDAQFDLENQKLDQLQQEVQDIKEVILPSPQPEGQ